jgi:N-acetylglucosamine kinase-like BadF-type ATPase
VFLAHDSITGFLGSMGVEQGTVTAVGTGVVTLAVGETEWARVDGWGNLIGDSGSAYWIGRAGLEAAMRAYDGRIPPTQLSALVTDNFTNPEEAYIELQTSDDRVSKIAALAKDIIALADSDSAARDIVESAGRELAHSAVTAARRTGLLETPAPRFSWAGNVMKAPALRNAFVQAITDAVPGADILEPFGEPIDGVALLPSVPDTSPIASVIHRAHR